MTETHSVKSSRSDSRRRPSVELKQTMKLPRWIATAAILGLTLPVLPADADDQAELIKQLLQRIDSLEKKVNTL